MDDFESEHEGFTFADDEAERHPSFRSMPDSAGWKKVSEKGLQQGDAARRLFDRMRTDWESNEALVAGETHFFDLLTPDHHLVSKIYQQLNRYVKNFPGWRLTRREATPSEREDYRIKRKGKAYFVQAVYKVPYDGEYPAFADASASLSGDASGDQDSSEEETLEINEETANTSSFFKSSNSAFTPARFRLQDSTNAGIEQKPRAEVTKTVPTRVGDSIPAYLDPTRSFVPVISSPVRMKAPSAAERSPYERPEPSVFASFSDDVLHAAPQNELPGGFVYGDVVEVHGVAQRAMVLQSAPPSTDDMLLLSPGLPEGLARPRDRLIVQTNDLQRLEVEVDQLTLVKGMPRWKPKTATAASAILSPPSKPPDGRSNLPM